MINVIAREQINSSDNPEITVLYRNCGEEFDVQCPCQHCGQEVRTITINVDDAIGVLEHLRGRYYKSGIKRWAKEFESGEEVYHDNNKVQTVIRVKDWENRHEPDSYHEVITDTDTGAIIKDFKQAFKEHQGHGYAKHKIPDFPDEWIRVAAYYIWQRGGCRDGRHVNHWNEAKAELKRLWRGRRLPRIG